MSPKLRNLIVLLAFIGVAEAGLPYVAFAAPLGGVLLNMYIAIGLAFFLIVAILDSLTEDAARSAFERQLMDTVSAQQKISRWRSQLLGVLAIVQRIACWPAFEAGLHQFRMWQNGVRFTGNMSRLAAVGLFPYEISLSLYLALAATLTTLVALWTGHPSVYARAFLWLLIGAMAAKHVAALLSPLSIQQRLQRAIDPIVTSYLVITFADLACLMLAYNGVINWRSGPVMSGTSLRTVYDQLRVFKDIFGAWENLPSSELGYAAAISGMLWLFTLANSLLKIVSSSTRTTDDRLAIAINCAVVGLDQRARSALAATDPTTRDQFEQKGVAYAGLGEFATAAPYLAEFLRQLMLQHPVPSADYMMIEMAEMLPMVPGSTDLFAKLIHYGAQNGMSDTFLATLALDAKAFGASPSAIADKMTQSKLHEHFPLGFVTFKWLADQEREVVGFYDALPQPAPGADCMTWRCCAALLLPARQLAPEATGQAILQWIESALPAILADARAAVPLHRLLVMSQLTRVQIYLGRGERPLPGLAAAIASLQAMLGDDALVLRRLRLSGVSLSPNPAGP